VLVTFIKQSLDRQDVRWYKKSTGIIYDGVIRGAVVYCLEEHHSISKIEGESGGQKAHANVDIPIINRHIWMCDSPLGHDRSDGPLGHNRRILDEP
jgi:hypothetical protein